MVYKINEYIPQLDIGRIGENQFRRFDFDVTAWLNEYPNATIGAIFKRADGQTYPVVIETNDGIVSWEVTATELTEKGIAYFELQLYSGQTIGKSQIIAVCVKDALTAGETPPDPIVPWVDAINERIGIAEGIIDEHIGDHFNPHEVTAEQVGLGNVDNTSDADKPISSATEAEIERIDEQYGVAYEQLSNDLLAVKDTIPNDASGVNQLATESFVNSSVATNTANYISNNGQPFTSLAQLQAYSGVKTNNDYAFVSDGTDYTRYKWVANENRWSEEYKISISGTSFTDEQWAAINSGITATLVGKITDNESAISTINLILPEKYEKPLAGIPKSDLSTDVQTSLGKADSAATMADVNAKYTKPSGGIPASDMTDAVQASLALADTALQESVFETLADERVSPASATYTFSTTKRLRYVIVKFFPTGGTASAATISFKCGNAEIMNVSITGAIANVNRYSAACAERIGNVWRGEATASGANNTSAMGAKNASVNSFAYTAGVDDPTRKYEYCDRIEISATSIPNNSRVIVYGVEG